MPEQEKKQKQLVLKVEAQKQQLERLVSKIETQGQQLERLVSKIETQGQYYRHSHELFDQKLDKLARLASVSNFSNYQLFNRRLTKAHCDILEQEWSRKLGIKVTPRSLAYLAHRICTLESAGKGRLAATIEDAVLRVLVASAVKNKKLRVLEIGTLFGVGLAAIYDHTSSRFSSVHLTAIDPFDGYYREGIRDILTDEAVNEPIFRSNLAMAGVPEQDYTLIKSMSTENSSIESATKSLHDVLIIDGDHSYSAVKSDFVNYLPAVREEGYIIFDDYDVPEWPDVKEFVDTIVRDSSDVTLVGVSWRTAVFQVVQKSEETTNSSTN